MPRNQKGRLGPSPLVPLPSDGGEGPASATRLEEALVPSALIRLSSGGRGGGPTSSGLGSRRGKPRPRKLSAGPLVGWGKGDGRTTVGLVRPSAERLAPKSTGFTKATLRTPQRSPV